MSEDERSDDSPHIKPTDVNAELTELDEDYDETTQTLHKTRRSMRKKSPQALSAKQRKRSAPQTSYSTKENFRTYTSIDEIATAAIDIITAARASVEKAPLILLKNAFLQIRAIERSKPAPTSSTHIDTSAPTISKTPTDLKPPFSKEQLKEFESTIQDNFTEINNKLAEIRTIQQELNSQFQASQLQQSAIRKQQYETEPATTHQTDTATYSQAMSSPEKRQESREQPRQSPISKSLYHQAIRTIYQSKRTIYITANNQSASGNEIMSLLKTKNLNTHAKIKRTTIFRKSIDVICATVQDATQLINDLNAHTDLQTQLQYKSKPCPMQRFLIMGIPQDSPDQHIREHLLELCQLPEDLKDSLQIIRKTNTRVDHVKNWVIQAPSPLAEAFIKTQTIQLGLLIHQIKPLTHVIRCIKCQSLEHSSTSCTARLICSHCSGSHKNEQCRNRPSCINCQRENAKRRRTGEPPLYSDHPAYDPRCPIYDEKYRICREALDRKYSPVLKEPTRPSRRDAQGPDNSTQQVSSRQRSRPRPNRSNSRVTINPQPSTTQRQRSQSRMPNSRRTPNHSSEDSGNNRSDARQGAQNTVQQSSCPKHGSPQAAMDPSLITHMFMEFIRTNLPSSLQPSFSGSSG